MLGIVDAEADHILARTHDRRMQLQGSCVINGQRVPCGGSICSDLLPCLQSLQVRMADQIYHIRKAESEILL